MRAAQPLSIVSPPRQAALRPLPAVGATSPGKTNEADSTDPRLQATIFRGWPTPRPQD